MTGDKSGAAPDRKVHAGDADPFHTPEPPVNPAPVLRSSDVLHDHQEFIPAVAVAAFPRKMLTELLRHCLKHHVAGLVAHPVVELLEVVDVSHHDGDVVSDNPVEIFPDRHPVSDVSQHVRLGNSFQFPVQPFHFEPLGDVLQHTLIPDNDADPHENGHGEIVERGNT